MPKHILRSLLRLVLNEPEIPDFALSSGCDALILDYEKGLKENRQAFTEKRVMNTVFQATQSGAEVFVRIARERAFSDLEKVVFPGVTGIVSPQAEKASEIQELDKYLTELEVRRGIARGSRQINAEIGTAAGVWNSLEIARASPRMSALTVAETNLYYSLELQPEAILDFDPLEYIKFELITNATAAGIQAQGMSYPLSFTLAEVQDSELKNAVRIARDMGFKGAVCPHASWVKACTEGFCPSPEELAYYRRVREVFAEGLRRGLASVPLDGRMVDVPVDLRAKVFLEWGERCQRRDAEKAATMKRGR